MNNNEFENKANDGYEVYSKSYTPSENGYEEYRDSYTEGAARASKKRGLNKTILISLASIILALSLCFGMVALTESIVSEKYEAMMREDSGVTVETKPSKGGVDAPKPSNISDGTTQSGNKNNWFYGLEGNTEITVAEPVDRESASGKKIGDDNLTFADVAELVSASVVEITTSETLRNGLVYSSGAGSGVIVTESGIIITNNHVVENATEIKVRLSNGNVYDAALVATDAQTDLAVIKITPSETLTVAVGVNSDSVRVGDEVLAIGNPLGILGGTVTNGIVSALEREVNIEGESMALMQHNAAVSPGNSGGALFNMKGQLIGIVNAKYSSNGAEGLGFAIPMNTVSEVYEDLITYGYVRGRADHGLSIIQQYTLRPGFYGYILYIVESKYNSDILYGDRLVAINGQTPESAEAAYAMLDGLDIGDTVEITVYRGSEEITVELTVSEYHP
jgi:serine protease Do